MRAFPAPSPEIAAARVGPAATSTDSERNDPAASPLDSLPTSSLIVRAWCGLALWALSEHRQAVSSSGGGGGGSGSGSAGTGGRGGCTGGGSEGGDGDGDAGCSSAPDGEKSGVAVAFQGNAPTPAHKENGANEGSPLTAILRWLLSKQATPQGSDATVKKGVDNVVSVGKSVGSAAKAAVATAPSRANMAKWRPALLAALVRALARLRLPTRSGADPSEGLEETELFWEHLEAPIVGFSPPPHSESAGPVCSDCARAEYVESIILRGHNERASGGGGKGGNDVRGCSADTQDVVAARFSPLWLPLLAGALRERCDCHKPDAASPSSARRREDERPSFARQIHSPVSPADGRLEGAGSRHHTPLPRAALVAEILTLAPKKGTARVLSSLSTAVADLSEKANSTSSTCPDKAEKKPDTDNVCNSLARQRSSALLAMGRVWRAEAARILSGWKSIGLDRLAGDGSVDEALDSPQRARGGLKRRVASHNPVGSTCAQPSDRLLEDTADSLQFLLKTASLVSRSPALAWEPISCIGGSAEGVGGAMLGRDYGAERFAVGWVGGSVEPGAEGRLYDDEAAARTCSQGSSFNAVDAAFGADAADLWRKLFDARQGHPPGFSSLLRKIAKYFAALALSRSDDAVVGLSSLEDGVGLGSQVPSELDGNSKGWTLAFSQTQTQRNSGRDRRRGVTVDDGQKNAADNLKQGGLQEQHLAPPPPFSCLPVLTAAARGLLRAAPQEPDNKFRGLAWGTGLVTLAWILTSSIPARPTPNPASAATPSSARKKGGGHSPETPPRTAASLMADGVFTDIRECVVVVRRRVASGSGERRPPRPIFPLDEDSLSSLSCLLALGISRSGDGAQRGASVGRSSRTSPAQASCVAANPVVSEEVRALALSVVSAVKGFSPDELVSPDILPALSPMLEAVLEIPRSRCASCV